MITLLLAVLALAGCASAGAAVAAPARGPDQLDASLREEVHGVTVAAADAMIVGRPIAPRRRGPFPGSS